MLPPGDRRWTSGIRPETERRPVAAGLFQVFVVPAYPPPPLCPSTGLSKATEWALNRCFQDFLGPLLFVVLNAGLGVCDAFVEGKGGSVMSVMVQSVHNNIVPHIAAPCGLL